MLVLLHAYDKESSERIRKSGHGFQGIIRPNRFEIVPVALIGLRPCKIDNRRITLVVSEAI